MSPQIEALQKKYKLNKITTNLLTVVEKHFGLKEDYNSDDNSNNVAFYAPVNNSIGCWGFEIKPFDDAYDQIDMDLEDRGYYTEANQRAEKRFLRIDKSPYDNHNAIIIYAQNDNRQAGTDLFHDNGLVIMHRSSMRLHHITEKDIKMIDKALDSVDNGKVGFQNEDAGKFYRTFAYTPAYAKKVNATLKQRYEKEHEKEHEQQEQVEHSHQDYLKHLGAKHSHDVLFNIDTNFAVVEEQIASAQKAPQGNITGQEFSLSSQEARILGKLLGFYRQDTIKAMHQVAKNKFKKYHSLDTCEKKPFIDGVDKDCKTLSQECHQDKTVFLNHTQEALVTGMLDSFHENYGLCDVLTDNPNASDINSDVTFILSKQQNAVMCNLWKELALHRCLYWKPSKNALAVKEYYDKIVRPKQKRDIYHIINYYAPMNIKGTGVIVTDYANAYIKANKIIWDDNNPINKNLPLKHIYNRIDNYMGELLLDKNAFNGNEILIIYTPHPRHRGIEKLKKRDVPYLKHIINNIGDHDKQVKAINKLKYDRLGFN